MSRIGALWPTQINDLLRLAFFTTAAIVTRPA
jgi:hypothetical protein